jgi:hypothetical protein
MQSNHCRLLFAATLAHTDTSFMLIIQVQLKAELLHHGPNSPIAWNSNIYINVYLISADGTWQIEQNRGRGGNQVDGISVDLIKYMARRLSNRYPKKDILVQL